MLPEHRDEDAATALFKKTTETNGIPEKLLLIRAGGILQGYATSIFCFCSADFIILLTSCRSIPSITLLSRIII